MSRQHYQKKVKLSVENKRTKWAPVWAVLRKFGVGKKVHPSEITARRRHWRRIKLNIKPRKIRNNHLG
jgi:ribosomal protein L39E